MVVASILVVAAAVWLFRDDPKVPDTKRPAAGASKAPGMAAGLAASPIAAHSNSLGAASALEVWSTSEPSGQQAIDRIVAGMSEAELIATLESVWLAEPEGAKTDLALQLLRRWTERAPNVAAEWIAGRVESAAQMDGVKTVASAWAGSDPIAAGQWVRQLPGEQRISGIVAVGYEGASTKPAESLWLAAELAPGSMRDDLIEHVVREWVAVNTNTPLAWAQQLPQSSLREQVFGSAAVSLSEIDPPAAARLALEELSEGKRRDDVVVSIVQRWAQQDASEAAEWVLSFPEGQLREHALENLVQLWAGKSLQQTAEWLGELEEGRARDIAIGAYSQLLAPSAPRVALVWAETISDAEQRQREIKLISETSTSVTGPQSETVAQP